jgi:hypothetical protein
MNRILCFVLFLPVFVLFGTCSNENSGVRNDMVGAWVLKKVIFPTGYETVYPNDRGYTRCKIYDMDSTFYYAELLTVDSETMIVPL